MLPLRHKANLSIPFWTAAHSDNRVAQYTWRKSPSTFFCIHELTNSYDWLESMSPLTYIDHGQFCSAASSGLLLPYATLIPSLEKGLLKAQVAMILLKKIILSTLLTWATFPGLCPVFYNRKINWPDIWAERVSSCSFQNPDIFFSLTPKRCKTLVPTLRFCLQAKKERAHC